MTVMNLEAYLSGRGEIAPGSSTEWMPFHTLDVPTGALWVGDPHLANADDGCVARVVPGTYQIEALGGSVYGERVVSRLRVRLASVSDCEVGDDVGDTGTDSAMIGVCDIEAFDAACGPDNGEDVQEAIETQTETGYGVITLADFPGAVMPFVPIGSDGGGPVLGLVSQGKLIGIELSFVDGDEGVEDEEDEDED